MKLNSLARAATLLALSFVTAGPARSQQPAAPPAKVDLGAFINEIMIMRKVGAQTQLAMWFPHEFFIEAGMAEGGKTRAATEKDMELLKPYLIVVVQRSVDQPDGKSSYAGEAEVRPRAALRLPDGVEVLPLDRMPPLVSAAVVAMKSMVTADGGAASANMHILIFPGSTKEGKPIVNSAQQDKLTLVLKSDKRFNEADFTWRTPFDAATRTPDCPRCKAGLSVKWSYCPYCGQKMSR